MTDQPMQDAFSRDPADRQRAFADLRSQCPVHRLPGGELFAVSREAVNAGLQHVEHFSTDLLGIAAPPTIAGVDQKPLDGASFAASFTAADAPDPRDTQYYEMFGCRAIRHEGWKAVVYHPIQADEPLQAMSAPATNGAGALVTTPPSW